MFSAWFYDWHSENGQIILKFKGKLKIDWACHMVNTSQCEVDYVKKNWEVRWHMIQLKMGLAFYHMTVHVYQVILRVEMLKASHHNVKTNN